MFIESVDGDRFRGQQSSYAAKLCDEFVVRYVAMMNLKFETHVEEGYVLSRAPYSAR